MIRVMKKIKLPTEGKSRPVAFRQFENVEDAIEHMGSEEELLAFLNASIIEHDRKQLRYFDSVGSRAQIIHYDNFGCFLTGD